MENRHFYDSTYIYYKQGLKYSEFKGKKKREESVQRALAGSQGILGTAAFRALRSVSVFYLPSLICRFKITPSSLIKRASEAEILHVQA